MSTIDTTATALQAADQSLQRAFDKPSEKSDKLGKDDFLKLMMAQVTNQDPLNPLDSQGMMDQLTSMGSLEQLVNINGQLGELKGTQADIVRSNAFSFLDKDVSVRGGNIPVNGGKAPGLQYSLPRQAKSVLVNILKADGSALRQIELGTQKEGAHTLPWDGLDNEGQAVADGYYNYNVIAKGGDDQVIPTDLFIRGKVAGVNFNKGRPMLKVNGEDVDINDVIELSNRSEKLFSDRVPTNMREDLSPRPPAERRRR